jgi:hypothetical protein
MNKHIVCCIHPFVANQEIDVYQDGECIKAVNCTLEQLEDTIVELGIKYNINKIDLKGGQLYSLKIKENLELNKYTENKFEVYIH